VNPTGVKLGRVFGTLGWLAFFAWLACGCSAVPGLPDKLPEVKPADARTAYKAALTACIACQTFDLPDAGAVSDGCAELAPVCDALAGVCK